jgi:methylthioribose-1-phosphate isomerase
VNPTTPTLEWVDEHLRIIDQTRLAAELAVIDVTTETEAVDAISRLAVRGAPALGAFGGYAIIVGLDEQPPPDLPAARDRLEQLRRSIGDARPTAVNLRWAVDRVIDAGLESGAVSVADMRRVMLAEAHAVMREDQQACASIGEHGAGLLDDMTVVGTHCNAGRLATAGIGSALGPIYTKASRGEALRVIASETRPLLQGARLTAWELSDAGIDVAVVPDGAMASLILSNQLDAFIVGADRIAANGDVANKVGTLSHALACREAAVPFFVAAPTSTIDLSLPSGKGVVIEQRPPDEIHNVGTTRITPPAVSTLNPAFDVTPHRFVTAIITEVGVLRPPYERSIAAAVDHRRRPA